MIGIGRQSLSLAQPAEAGGRNIAFTTLATVSYDTGQFDNSMSAGGVRTNATSAFNFGSSDWVIEWWMYYTSLTNSASANLFIQDTVTDEQVLGMYIERDTRFSPNYLMQFYIQDSTGVNRYSNPRISISAATWYHMAFTRSGSTISSYFNGSLIGSTSGVTNAVKSLTNPAVYISAGPGRIDDLRIQTGTGTYAGTPGSALTNTANTQLLVHFDSTVVDDATG